jgi:septal ring factor EnvC (AmiA/AmiB activator)
MGDLAKALFTTDLAIKHLQDTVEAQNKQMDALADDVKQVSRELRMVGERLVRLEAMRDADRAQLMAEIAQFKTEVERAQMRFARQLPPADQV